ncbi:ErpC protein (plasmid) [Borreliella finlandensis]|uniref:ErpC protein n=1 Tax=Borreliella finlandensis TaxID=498741 RepID=UPI003AF05B6A
MNKKIKIFIICTVVVLISSCKNYHVSSKDLEQNVKGKVQGFVDKILDPAKDKIASNGPIADELAKKLQEEELMQGDDSNNSQLSPPPVLPASGQDNNLPVLKAEQQIGGQQEGKKEEVKPEEEKKLEDRKEKQEFKPEEEKAEDKKEKVKAKEGKGRGKKGEKGRGKKGEKGRGKKGEKGRGKKERLRERDRVRERERERESEEQQAKSKIKMLAEEIDKITGDIDTIKRQTRVGAEEVRDKITVPIYDHFIDDGDDEDSSIYYVSSLEDGKSEGLEKLLKELNKTRSELRTKLNEGNQEYTGGKEPHLKEGVNIDEIESDLDKLKSQLEKIKKEYLKN